MSGAGRPGSLREGTLEELVNAMPIERVHLCLGQMRKLRHLKIYANPRIDEALWARHRRPRWIDR